MPEIRVGRSLHFLGWCIWASLGDRIKQSFLLQIATFPSPICPRLLLFQPLPCPLYLFPVLPNSSAALSSSCLLLCLDRHQWNGTHVPVGATSLCTVATVQFMVQLWLLALEESSLHHYTSMILPITWFGSGYIKITYLFYHLTLLAISVLT